MMIGQSVLPTLGQENCNDQHKTHEERIGSQGKDVLLSKQDSPTTMGNETLIKCSSEARHSTVQQ